MILADFRFEDASLHNRGNIILQKALHLTIQTSFLGSTHSRIHTPPQQSSHMCQAKARVAKCGHTVEYEIMIPCENHVAGSPPCAAWDQHLMNKVLLRDHPICTACHLQKEKNICREYVNAEIDLVRFPMRRVGSPKEVWEARLLSGEKMMAAVGRLDVMIGRKKEWREEVRRADWCNL